MRQLVPGSVLREGLDHILRARTGALIVCTDREDLSRIITGGIPLDVEISPALLYELAKMDGAIVLNEAATRARHANAQLVPDPTIPSQETGIRHRSAERTAKQTGDLVIAISQRRDIITVYQGTLKYSLQDVTLVLARANQLVQTLERYVTALARALDELTALEFRSLVTLADVTAVLRRLQLVLQLHGEAEFHVLELGTEGRLLQLQVRELTSDVNAQGLMLIQDYLAETAAAGAEEIYEQLLQLEVGSGSAADLARLLGYSTAAVGGLATPLVPKGYRMLSKIPRLPRAVSENVIRRFGNLQSIQSATLEQLDEVEGIGEARAKAIHAGLRLLRERPYLSPALDSTFIVGND